MKSRLSQSLVRYYVALRLSAGAAMLYLPFETPTPRAPIVRASAMVGPAGFDHREIIEHANRLNVVTMPHTGQPTSAQPSIGLN